MATMWRIYEIADNGHRSVAGFGDHASLASAQTAVERWGKIVAWELDEEHDAVDAIILPGKGLGAVQIAIEPIINGQSWPTC